MPAIVIRLDPAQLANPDADLRYVLPDLIAERSGGVITADGYDYLDDDQMLLFLRTDDLTAATDVVLEVVRGERPLGNSLTSAVVGARDADEPDDAPYVVVHPPEHRGEIVLGTAPGDGSPRS